LIRLTTPPFETAYTLAPYSPPVRAVWLEKLIIRPQFVAFMGSVAARQRKSWLLTLTSMVRDQAASSTLSSCKRSMIPATLTYMSRRPKRSMVCATRLSQFSGRERSKARAIWPSPSKSLTVFSNSSPSMSQATTWAPKRANSWAVAAPRPRAAPVIIATHPGKPKSVPKRGSSRVPVSA